MPKRTDIKKIMLIGSGPIVIGQGCEFDYSGVQACKVLRHEGFEVVLVNSNPATIMTDPEMADRTYIEPLSVDILHEIIRRERPDALLPTLGGQTALNLAMELEEKEILNRYNVELIGAKAESIKRAEDRHLFKEAMLKIGLDLPCSGSAHSMNEAIAIANTIGSWPLIIRPGFTLGGTGGGIAYNSEEFETIVTRGLDASLNSEVLIEESLIGWKEFEMEVMRDCKGNAVIVCSIENFDPMGVHTGDSITVAPIQSLDDRAYQAMRDDSLKVMEAIGVETGGSNVQWAIEPNTGRRIIIEMNPRVSRSSALASKATGFPIAKIAALLAVGYTLDELRNDITQTTPSCFEPALDYVVTKVPRFTFEKFPKADSTLGTQMKSVGEAMAIGSNFKQSIQKALRSLETGFGGFGACAKCEQFLAYNDEKLAKEVASPSAERVFVLYAAFRRGWDIEKLYSLTKIDRYFLRHLEEIACFEDEIRAVGSLENLCKDKLLFRQAKEFGFSDIQISYLFHKTPEEVMKARNAISLKPSYYSVDTCAGEFEAITPYYYSCYAEHSEPVRQIEKNKGKKRIMVLGGGPNRIGQGIEFDYCCCHAAFTLSREGYEVIMVNSNPETVSTDYDTSDKLYFEPLTLEDVMGIYEREQCAGVIVQFGGQTPLNLAMRLKKAGAHVLGTSPEDIDLAEDRDFFKQLVDKVGIKQAESGIAHSVEEALAIVEKIGYPVLVRPSFVLGGRGMVIVYKEKYLRQFVEEAASIGESKPILIDRFLENATELDVDCICDGKRTVVGAIMEHVEPAGIHSGDSASIIPPMTLSKEIQDKVRYYAKEFARELHVVGLMNMQLAVKDGEIYMIEVNPRASRTVPFVSKTIGIPLPNYASRCMMGETLEQIGFTEEVHVPYVSVKEAVFPFVKFPGVDITLSPEMKSTGEVMSLDRDRGLAYLKSQLAAGNKVPAQGSIFVSLKDEDKQKAVPLIKQLVGLGYNICATRGTSTVLYNEGIKTRAVFRISRGRPNLLDLIRDKEVQWIVNTTEPSAEAMVDEIQMRSKAVVSGVPITTTLAALTSTVEGLEDRLAFNSGCYKTPKASLSHGNSAKASLPSLTRDKHDFGRFEVCSLQEYHRHVKK
jgi:carbamoyl-phosphate synthase large subunit